MKHLKGAKGNLFANKMNINLNMLGALVLDRIIGHVNSNNIVTKNKCGLG